MRHLHRTVLILLGWLLLMCGTLDAQATDAPAAGYRVYIGTFTGKGSKGIYLLQMDARTGALSEPRLVAEAQSPSYLAIDPRHRFLYCVNEVDSIDARPAGAISAFAIDTKAGGLEFINRQSSGGTSPTHITIDPLGKVVLVANYGSGSVTALPVGTDGRLGAVSSSNQHQGKGPDPQRQEGPHAHCVNVDPDGRFALSCDLGLDKVFIYRLDAAHEKLAPGDPASISTDGGSGPRHLAFHPSGKYVYVLNEMGCTVDAFDYDGQSGALKHLQTVPTLPADFKAPKSGAEIFVHPSGKFVYSSNRGEANNLAIFRVDPHSGKLTPTGHVSTQGRTPRGFGIDPGGKWLIAANQDSDNVVVFRINPETGELTPADVNIRVPTPVCIALAPSLPASTP